MDQLLSYLNTIHPLSETLREHLITIVRTKMIPKKGFLLKAGQYNREIYFIGKGLLRCYYFKGLKEVSTWFMAEGDVVVSIESFYDQKASYEYIVALEDCELFYISYNELEAIYRNYPEFNFIGRELTVKYLKLWARQLFNIRMQTADERYKILLENYPHLLQRVSSEHLSTYLDLNKTTVSKIRGKK